MQTKQTKFKHPKPKIIQEANSSKDEAIDISAYHLAPSRSLNNKNDKLSPLPDNGGEREKVKEFKRTPTGYNYNLASQNFRHLGGEAGKEELVLNMAKENLDMVAGQETCHEEDMEERWDTGHLFLNFGREKDSKSRAHDGVCFLLSKRMAKKYEQGGKMCKKYGNRLATIR